MSENGRGRISYTRFWRCECNGDRNITVDQGIGEFVNKLAESIAQMERENLAYSYKPQTYSKKVKWEHEERKKYEALRR
jgi:hypothetical protein